MKVPINQIHTNIDNPRVIKNDKFKKLVKSIKEFPKMLKLRPIVVDEDFTILGGNMRYKACIEAGLKEVPITIAKGLTEEQKREFIVKDNVGFGEWDYDLLANEWDSVQLAEWGLDVWENEDDKEEEIIEEIEFSEFLDECNNYVVLYFDNEIDWLSAQTHFDISSVYSKRANGKEWSKGVGRVLNGGKYLKSIKKI
tara:strand:- start:1924 stop:2514 length:591 start_codon:yes stop_codon:yes gene_type:complete